MTAADTDIVQVAFYSAFGALLLAAGIYDLWRFRIPNTISVALAVLFLPAAAYGFGLEPIPWLMHLGAGVLMFALGIGIYAFGFLGGGDVKLLGATALWIGIGDLHEYVFFVAIVGGGLSLLLIPLRRIVQGLVVRFATEPDHVPIPRIFIPGESVPYGVAVAAGAIPMMGALPVLGGA